MAAGEFQGGVAFGHQFGDQGYIPLPIDVALRVGVLDRMDISLRARPATAEPPLSIFEAGTKFQLLRDDRIELSFAPSVVSAKIDRVAFDSEITPSERAEFEFGRLAVIVGTSAEDVGSFWLAPTIDAGVRRIPVGMITQTEPLVALGSCVGIGLRLGADVQLLVQAGLTVGAAGKTYVVEADRNYETILGPGDLVSEVSLGLLLGGFAD